MVAEQIGVAGLGAIGKEVVRKLAEGIPGCQLAGVASRDTEKARTFLREEGIDVPLVELAALVPLSDVVVECLPPDLLTAIAEPMLRDGKEVVVLSVGALLDSPHLLDLAREYGGRLIVPSGALLGLDAVGAAAEGVVHSIKITSRKPVKGLIGAPFLGQNMLSIEDIRVPQLLFSGTAREAIVGFPANLNVAVALGLAGIGVDDTQVEIWADPDISRNSHLVEVDADAATFMMKIDNVPSENPRTGLITALSVVSLLRKRHAPLVVGS